MDQKDSNKTPLQNALSKIKTAYIAAFISAGITLITVILLATGHSIINGVNMYAIVDVIFLIILAVLIMILKSRIASIILFAYFLMGKVSIFIANPAAVSSSILLASAFAVAFFMGILGTFSYHKIKKQEQNNSMSEEKTEVL